MATFIPSFSQSDQSSLGAFGTDKNAKIVHADNEDSDQTARMRRLIRVFVGRVGQKVRFLKLRLINISIIVIQ